jgi:hypothetical protein
MTGAMLNARTLVLGAALGPTIRASRTKRAFLGWWLIDEAAGLALAERGWRMRRKGLRSAPAAARRSMRLLLTLVLLLSEGCCAMLGTSVRVPL